MPQYFQPTAPRPSGLGAGISGEGANGQQGSSNATTQPTPTSMPLTLPEYDPNAAPLNPNLGQGRAVTVPVRALTEFNGINTQAPPEAMSGIESPYCLNVDGIRRVGVLQPRLGVAKLGTHGTYEDGVCVVPLGFTISGAAQMLIVTENGGTPNYQVVSQTLSIPQVKDRILAPTGLTLADAGTKRFTVAIDAMPMIGGIESVLIAWNIRTTTPRPPVSPWVFSGGYTDYITEIAWYGESAFASGNIASNLTVAGTANITVWVKTRLGMSQPASAKVAIA